MGVVGWWCGGVLLVVGGGTPYPHHGAARDP
jgi:hypothetical protein